VSPRMKRDTASAPSTGGADGTVWCWGANPYGQRGDGAASMRFVPARAAL